MTNDEMRDLCRAVAGKFLRNHGWTLAFEWVKGKQQVTDLFLEGALGYVAPGWDGAASLEIQKNLIRQGVLNQYSRVLYQACLQPGSTRAEIAYTELWNHLYDVAHYELRGDKGGAADCAQVALLSLFKRFEREPQGFMRDEGAFLAYARKTLLHETWRYVKKRGETVDLIKHDTEGDDELPDVPDPGQRANGDITHRVTRQDVEAAVRTCLGSDQQQRVILGLFLEGLGVWELAQELDCSPENVYVLKSRALKRLRTCPGLYEKLIDALSNGGVERE